MADIFISYARATEDAARRLAEHLRALGYSVWRDDELPAHRAYADVIEERLRAAKAVVVIWSAEAVKSQWVRAEAEVAREARTLVQISIDGVLPPIPFNQIQCAGMTGWQGEADAPGLRTLLLSIAELLQTGAPAAPVPTVQNRPAAYAGRTIVAVPAPAGSAASDPLSDGLRTDIVAALSSYLMLVALPIRDAHADYQLEISSRHAQLAVRVSARLTDVASGEIVWMERYEGVGDNLFALEDKVTLGVAASVEATIRRLLLKQAVQTPQTSTDVDALYLRGAMEAMRAEKDAKIEAAALLERVVAERPHHQHALAVAALAHLNIWMNGYLEGGEADHAIALGFARRTLALSDSDPVSTGLAAVTLAHLGEPLDVSIALIDRILALHPTFSPAWLWSGQIRLIAGDLEAAQEHLATSNSLDPRMTSRAILLGCQGACEMLLGHFAAACSLLREAAHLSEHLVFNNLLLAACLAHAGLIDDAIAQYKSAANIAPPGRFRLPLRKREHRALFEAGLAIAAEQAAP